MENMPAIQAIVKGRVQGVGFRHFVIREARQLGLTGRVRNMPNGREVEVQAEGDKETLENFIGVLKKGPTMSRVTDIDLNWKEHDGRFDTFDVTF